MIIFDEGGYTVSVGTGGAVTITFEGRYCSSEQPGPNLAPFPQTNTVPGSIYTLVTGEYGGDRTGGVLLSPLLKPCAVSNMPFNHYSLLKTLEDIYRTNGYLGYAGQAGLLSFFGCVSSDIKPNGSEAADACQQ